MKKIKKLLSDNLWLFKICYKAAPAYMICYIIEAIRNELVVFLEFTLALNFVLECAEFGRPFQNGCNFPAFASCIRSFRPAVQRIPVSEITAESTAENQTGYKADDV